jgi:phage/plasmid-like protein (TIGR03299 family)
MFSARELPWHRLGTVTPDVLTAAEALTTAGLDWTVETRPVFTTKLTDTGVTFVEVEGKNATVRTSDEKALGIVGTRYHPVQNTELFDFVDYIVSDSGAKYETAGSLKGGRVVFMTVRMADEMQVLGEGYVPYLVCTSSHDGTMAVTAAATPVRIVCANTLTAGLRAAKSKFTVRHTATATQKVADARTALKLTWEYLDDFALEAEQLAEVNVSDGDIEQLLAELFPTKEGDPDRVKTRNANRASQVMAVYAGRTLDGMRGNGWGFIQAVNEWELWKSPVRGGEDVRHERQASRILGNQLNLTSKARELVLAGKELVTS